jgi:hypothetical protein
MAGLPFNGDQVPGLSELKTTMWNSERLVRSSLSHMATHDLERAALTGATEAE